MSVITIIRWDAY